MVVDEMQEDARDLGERIAILQVTVSEEEDRGRRNWDGRAQSQPREMTMRDPRAGVRTKGYGIPIEYQSRKRPVQKGALKVKGG